MVGPVLLPILGLTIIFAVFFFLPEGWPTWLIGLLAAFACFVAGAMLALVRSPYLALLSLLAPLALAPLTSSLAGRLRRRLDPPPSREEFTFRDDSLYSLIGRSGRALTPLRPAGSVDFDGRRLDGLSEGEYIAEGTTVRGLRVRGRYLIVGTLHDPPHHEG